MNCGIECISNKFTDNMPEGGHARDLDWLERWACANLRVQQGQVQGDWDNPKHKYRLDGEHVESRKGRESFG